MKKLEPLLEVWSIENEPAEEIVQRLLLRTGPDHLGYRDHIERGEHDITSFCVFTQKDAEFRYNWRYLVVWTNRKAPSHQEALEAIRETYETETTIENEPAEEIVQRLLLRTGPDQRTPQ